MTDDGDTPGDTGVTLERAHARPLTPAEAADRLGVKAAMLRRHAAAYEEVFGPLPRENRARVYPLEALQRLQRAVSDYRDGHAASVTEALRRRASGEPDPPAEESERTLARRDTSHALGLLLTEVQALAARVDDHARGIDEHVRGDGATLAALQARVMELQEEARELERRNAALRDALRDRELELERERRRRPLWRRMLTGGGE